MFVLEHHGGISMAKIRIYPIGDYTHFTKKGHKKRGLAGPLSLSDCQSILTEVPLAVDIVEIELAKRSV